MSSRTNSQAYNLCPIQIQSWWLHLEPFLWLLLVSLALGLLVWSGKLAHSCYFDISILSLYHAIYHYPQLTTSSNSFQQNQSSQSCILVRYLLCFFVSLDILGMLLMLIMPILNTVFLYSDSCFIFAIWLRLLLSGELLNCVTRRPFSTSWRSCEGFITLYQKSCWYLYFWLYCCCLYQVGYPVHQCCLEY